MIDCVQLVELGVPLYTYLFNLNDDPEERVDLSAVYPEKVATLTALLETYKTSMVESISCP